MTTITRESAEIKSFITGFLSDPAHDNQSSNSLLTNVFRIALASLEAVSDERAAYELFMEKRFGGSVDRRRAKNGDGEYMAWDMAIGWIIWCHRAAMPQAGNFRENKNSSTSSPATPDDWISCSERTSGKQVIELTMLVKQLVSQLKKAKPDCKLPDRAMDYLLRNVLISVEGVLR
ncbi:hypothetical protein C5887_005019 [Escherichia coli O128:H42]|uniref:hypothetical protein n=2 Tax=Escherichia coli TaxID=562 RepID=UPI000B7F251F|nr:hypothetical protein [Escherichia coli]EFA4143125.1 hypothetical protein [Escherichia coli O78:H42]EFA4190730.1 hypothetical protein [Escherichia coli O128:H42]EFB8895264.1 hypothetical protein [Escherichia coli]EKI8170314.1 hypothetical protein [Escherichia coli]MBC0964054.1 hypothetical protein [Escherichia coli]